MSYLIMVPASEIRAQEVLSHWVHTREHWWAKGYTVYQPTLRSLKAIIEDSSGEIALLWDTYTGELHQHRPELLRGLMAPLGYAEKEGMMELIMRAEVIERIQSTSSGTDEAEKRCPLYNEVFGPFCRYWTSEGLMPKEASP